MVPLVPGVVDDELRVEVGCQLAMAQVKASDASQASYLAVVALLA